MLPDRGFPGGFIVAILVAGMCLLALSGCGKDDSLISALTPTVEAALSPTATGIATPLPTRLPVSEIPTPTLPPIQKTQYHIDAVLDYGRHHLQVEEQIQYTNSTKDIISDLILMTDPLYYPGVFLLNRLYINNVESISGTQTERGWIKIALNPPLLPGEQLAIAVDYELALPSPNPSPNVRPIPFGYTESQTNLVDWYPFIPPYQEGQGWLAHPASYYGEHLAYELADFEVNVRLAGGRQDLMIAASSVGVQDGDWTRYKHIDARNFAWSVSHNYQVISGTHRGVTINCYAYPSQRAANQAVFDATIKALEIFIDLFGPYQHKSLDVVQADFLDGMEYDGMYFLSKGFYNSYTGGQGEYLIAIAAHETAHQWWYAQVGNDQAMEPWLDEALSTYSERLYYEIASPESLKWWWDYRVNYYEPQGWVDMSIYNPHGNAQPYQGYRNAVYLNGAKFLEDLRIAIGDQEFFNFLKSYRLLQFQKISSTQSFWELLRQQTDVDLQALMKQYFYNEY